MRGKQVDGLDSARLDGCSLPLNEMTRVLEAEDQ